MPLCSHQNSAQANQSSSNRFASVQALYDIRDVSLFNNPGLKKVARFRKNKKSSADYFQNEMFISSAFLRSAILVAAVVAAAAEAKSEKLNECISETASDSSSFNKWNDAADLRPSFARSLSSAK